jgi:hypothetical protein
VLYVAFSCFFCLFKQKKQISRFPDALEGRLALYYVVGWIELESRRLRTFWLHRNRFCGCGHELFNTGVAFWMFCHGGAIRRHGVRRPIQPWPTVPPRGMVGACGSWVFTPRSCLSIPTFPADTVHSQSQDAIYRKLDATAIATLLGSLCCSASTLVVDLIPIT